MVAITRTELAVLDPTVPLGTANTDLTPWRDFLTDIKDRGAYDLHWGSNEQNFSGELQIAGNDYTYEYNHGTHILNSKDKSIFLYGPFDSKVYPYRGERIIFRKNGVNIEFFPNQASDLYNEINDELAQIHDTFKSLIEARRDITHADDLVALLY